MILLTLLIAIFFSFFLTQRINIITQVFNWQYTIYPFKSSRWKEKDEINGEFKKKLYSLYADYSEYWSVIIIIDNLYIEKEKKNELMLPKDFKKKFVDVRKKLFGKYC